MATRLYFEGDATTTTPFPGANPTITPAFDGSWEVTGSAARRWLSPSGALMGTPMLPTGTVAETSASTVDVLARQFISGPLSAQTIDGTVKGQIRAVESNTDADMRAQVVIKVCSNDGTTILATLLASDAAALSSEFDTGTAENRKFPLAASSPAALSSYACAAGDRLLVEIGYRASNATISSRNAQMVFGTIASSDLAEDETTTADDRPWIEFSDDITFEAVGRRVSQMGAIVLGSAPSNREVSQMGAIVLGTKDTTRSVTQMGVVVVGTIDLGWWDIGMDDYGVMEPVSVLEQGSFTPTPTAGNPVDAAPGTAEWDSLIGGRTVYAWYKLDETSGTTADNAEGTAARDGTYETTPLLGVEGLAQIRADDLAVTFNGTDEDVLIPSDVFQISTATSAWSMEVWFRTTGTAITCIAGGRHSTDADPINALYMLANGNLRWDTRDVNGAGLNQLTSSGALVNDGSWHHVAVVRTTGKAKTIYIDGVSRATGSDTMAAGTGVLDWGYIARERRNTYWFPGTISEVVIYQAALSAGDVTASYDGGFSDYVWYTTAFTPTVGNLILFAVLSQGSAPDEEPTKVWHPGVGSFELEGAVAWDPVDSATATRCLSVWSGIVTSATNGKIATSFTATQTAVIGRHVSVVDHDPEEQVRVVASVATDDSVDELTVAVGDKSLDSVIYAVSAFENTDDADDANSTGSLLNQTEGSGMTVAVHNAGNVTAPRVAWVTASRGAALAVEVMPRKPPPATNAAPTASFTRTPSSGTAPITVKVDASASSDSDGFISRYRVNWGDGSVSTETFPVIYHQYKVQGTYQIRVTVTDDDGATHTAAAQTVTISGGATNNIPLVTGCLSRSPFASYGPDGYNPEIKWSDLEPTEGNFVWTTIDNAIASGHPIRVRLFSGRFAPGWVKSAAGTVTVTNPQSAITAQVPKWWTQTYLDKWTAFVQEFASQYTVSDIPFIFAAGTMTIYGEPCIKGMSDATTRDNLRAAGLDVGGANDVAAMKATTEALADAFDYARIGVAFNPFQILTATSYKSDVNITIDLMRYFRHLYGERFVLQNNSLRETSQGTSYEAMYAEMRALGKPLSFQTATVARVGNLKTTMETKAIPWGAHAVEMPSGHTYSASQLATWQTSLEANVDNDNVPPATDKLHSIIMVESVGQVGATLDTLLDLDGVWGVSVSQPWSSFETSDGVYDFDRVDDVRVKAAAAGKKCQWRIRGGQHTPSFARGTTWVPQSGLAAGKTLPRPCDAGGGPNATFTAKYLDMMTEAMNYCLTYPSTMEILHGTYFGGLTSEKYVDNYLLTLSGNTQANVVAAHEELCDITLNLDPGIAVELPVGVAPYPPVAAALATQDAVIQFFIDFQDANPTRPMFMQGNAWTDTKRGWGYPFEPHGQQMISEDNGAVEWNWPGVYAGLEDPPAAYIEIHYESWANNANKSLLYSTALSYSR